MSNEKSKERQTFLFGQIFGKLMEIHPTLNTPALFKNACINPFKVTTQTLLTCRKAHLITNSVDEYLMYRYDDISPIFPEPLSMELQGIFQLGYYSVNTPCSKIVEKVIEKNKITQEELADKLGVNRSTVNRWGNGMSVPSIQIQYALECLAFE